MTATWPVQAPSTGRSATQPVDAPGARTATQPVEAPDARTDVFAQPTGTVSGDVGAVGRSLTGTAGATTGVSDTEDELDSELESPAVVSDQERTTSLTTSSLKRPTTRRQ